MSDDRQEKKIKIRILILKYPCYTRGSLTKIDYMDKTGIFTFCDGLIEEMNMNDGQRLSQGLHVVSDTRNICSNIMVCHHF